MRINTRFCVTLKQFVIMTINFIKTSVEFYKPVSIFKLLDQTLQHIATSFVIRIYQKIAAVAQGVARYTERKFSTMFTSVARHRWLSPEPRAWASLTQGHASIERYRPDSVSWTVICADPLHDLPPLTRDVYKRQIISSSKATYGLILFVSTVIQHTREEHHL